MMVIEYCRAPLLPAVSCTRAVKVKVPAVVGVPAIVPDVCKLSPLGKAPDSTLHEYGPWPPLAARAALYALCTVPLGSELVLIVSGATGCATMIEYCRAPLLPAVSCTRAVNVKVPAVVGVPVIAPEGCRLSPLGKAPDKTLHEYGPCPPAATNVAL